MSEPLGGAAGLWFQAPCQEVVPIPSDEREVGAPVRDPCGPLGARENFGGKGGLTCKKHDSGVVKMEKYNLGQN